MNTINNQILSTPQLLCAAALYIPASFAMDSYLIANKQGEKESLFTSVGRHLTRLTVSICFYTQIVIPFITHVSG